MNVVHLIAGAGGMYCGSCLHAGALAAALRREGMDLTVAPLYTPLRTEEDAGDAGRVAFGGIHVWLQQQSSLLGRLPGWLDRLLDRPGLLRWAGRLSGATRPQRLGPLVVSVLQGERGRQRRELDKLLAWLAELRPEVVHLSNALLVGTAREIRRRLGATVVCTFSGEDAFVEQLPEPYRSEAWGLLAERSAELDGLVAMNGYYADFMALRLRVARERIRVIRPGLNLAGHASEPRPPRAPSDDRPYTIGYLARVCPEKGLHVLAEAFIRLASRKTAGPVRLRAAGYLAPADRAYLAGIDRRLGRAGLAGQFEYVGQVDRAEKIAFLQSLDVLSVPTVYPEPKGLFVLEAWGNGVPVVVPDHGAFPELVADTGGGLLCGPGDPAGLAVALATLIDDPSLAAECGRRGHQAVHARYDAQRMARETIALYEVLRTYPRTLLTCRAGGDAGHVLG